MYLFEKGRLDDTGGLTVKTIRDVVLVLRLALTYGYVEKAIPMLNWELIEYPKDDKIHRVVSLSKDDEQALIQCIYLHLSRKSAGILIALMTGLRIGELCGLQMGDISLTDNTITVSRTVQRIYDKRKGESYIHIGPPKTESSVRTIPYPSLLGNIIKKYYTNNPSHYFLTGKSKPTEPRTYRQYFSRFLDRYDLPKVKFHEIRHTFAVRAIEIPDFDVKSLSEILGHKNVSFTLNVYGRANLQQNSLIGSPAGYVGCNHGELSEKIQKSKVGILLCDEFEKTTRPVYSFFLELLEEGRFTDSMAREYDMDGYVIIFTSNIPNESEYKKNIPPELQTRFDLVCEFEEPTSAEKEQFLELLLEKAVAKYPDKFSDYEITDADKRVLFSFDYSGITALRDIKRIFNNRLMDLFTQKGI